jgi:hypothetical protein
MSERKTPQRTFNLLLAAAASLIGFVALAITFASLFLGLWLDATFGTGKTWTVVSMILSVPVSLLSMLFMALGLVKRIVPQPPPQQTHQTNKEDSS